jgi:NSS family neurotransmitter:Na+ symporter
VLGVIGVGFLIGVPSAMNLDVLGNQDFVWGVALMISGAFVAYLVWQYGIAKLRSEIATPADWALPGVWNGLITWAVPLQAVVLLVWWMYLAATVYAPDSWYDPFNPYSVMTCLAQWGIVLVAFVLLNRWMARMVDRTTPTAGMDVYPDPADEALGMPPTP